MASVNKVPGPACNVCNTFVGPGEEYASYGPGLFAICWHQGCLPENLPLIGGIELETKVATPNIFTTEQVMVIKKINKEWGQLNIFNCPSFNRLEFIHNLIKKDVERSENEENLYQDLKTNEFI